MKWQRQTDPYGQTYYSATAHDRITIIVCKGTSALFLSWYWIAVERDGSIASSSFRDAGRPYEKMSLAQAKRTAEEWDKAAQQEEHDFLESRRPRKEQQCEPENSAPKSAESG